MDFAEKFVSFRDRFESSQDAAYQSQKNITVEGKVVSLYSALNHDSQRKLFGIMKLGTVGHAHDFRFLFGEPNLSPEKLLEYYEYGKKIQQTAVNPDKAHDFSLITVIVACGEIDKAALSKIKKLNSEKQYASGWSSLRIGLIDLSSGKIHTNRLGDAVKNIIKPAL